MKVFLSHASENKAIIRQLHSYLPKHVRSWLDEDELDLGVKFPNVIERAIKEESDFVMVFLGEEALQSDWVERELGWALQREKDLKRTFVLPILLEDVWDQVENEELQDRLYLECFDHSETGLKQTAERLSQLLFAQVSRHFGQMKTTGASEFLDDLERDFNSYKDIAFELSAILGNSLKVLSTNQAAFEQVSATVNRYNEFSSEFIKRLPSHCKQIQKLWGRNLAEECSAVMDFVENEVYRGQVYALNQVIEAIHLCDANRDMSSAEVDALDAEKEGLLVKVEEALHEMKNRCSALMAKLENEL